jgi:hypothetical protein
VDEFKEAQTIIELQAALRNAHRQLRQAKDRTAELVAVTHEAARDAMLAMGGVKAPPVPKRSTKRKGAEVALWHLTDWQGGKKTPSYDHDIMRQRVLRFVDKAETITDIQRSHHPVDDCVIMFGGDMVEGVCWNFPTQPHEISITLFDQYVMVSRLIIDVVNRALGIYNKVTVVAEWGNHGRLGNKRDAIPRHDNLDRMCYEFARQMLADNPRLIWEDSAEDVQRVQIGEYRAVLFHGDEIGRGGAASPMTIVRHVERWKSGAYPWAFRDAYLGHWHTQNCWALADGYGSVYQTGSTESENRYAGVMMAASAQPSQRLHFIDPVRGRVTAEYKVLLSD